MRIPGMRIAMFIFILICSLIQISHAEDLNTWLNRLPGGRLYLRSNCFIGYDSTNYGITTSTRVNLIGTLRTAGKRVFTSGTQNSITTTGALTITAECMVISATGTLVSVATPFISTATLTNPNGTRICLIGGTTTITLQDDGTLPGSCMELGASTRVLSSKDILELQIIDGKWYERLYVDY